jgi:glycosyltransferase involved in cell wall biosynthesis
MFVSVVIPTYNRRSSLARTLSGIMNQSSAASTYEIVVVDDCSADDTREYVQSIPGNVPNLLYLRHVANQGRVVTRNDGVRAAHGDIIIFLDDDNVPEEGFVEAHRRHHELQPDQHLVVMGNVRYARDAIHHSNFGRFMQSRYLGFRSPKDRASLDYQNLPPRCLGTLNCSMRRSDLLAVGLLDESFRHYGGEDEYLGYCLSRQGARIIFGEAARTVHYDEVTLTRFKAKLLEVGRWGLRVQAEKSPGYVESALTRFLLPVDWRRDGLTRIGAKVCVRVVTNPLAAVVLERWAVLTDRLDGLYWPTLYRMLLATWVSQGYRSTGGGPPLVTYGERK